MARHRDIDRALASIAATDLADLGRRLHTLVDLNRAHPSTPDGYPSSTLGAGTPTIHAHTLDPDGEITLTSVEAAANARTTHRDPLERAEQHAVQHLCLAAENLALAEQHLRRADQLRANRPDRPDADPGCWAMARVGGWEPVHRVTDLADILDRPLDEPRPLGRWAYDFARRVGRLPSIEECRRRRDGRKVMVAV